MDRTLDHYGDAEFVVPKSMPMQVYVGHAFLNGSFPSDQMIFVVSRLSRLGTET